MLRRARRHGDGGCPVPLVTGEETERNTWEESEWWVLDHTWLQGCGSSGSTRAASPRDARGHVCGDDGLPELVLEPGREGRGLLRRRPQVTAVLVKPSDSPGSTTPPGVKLWPLGHTWPAVLLSVA